MSEWGERAFDAVADITKQVITLSTGLIAVSIAFAKDFARLDEGTKRILGLSWTALLLAILLGILTLMVTAGAQQHASDTGSPPSINASNVRLFAAAHLILFMIGVTLAVVAGWLSTVA